MIFVILAHFLMSLRFAIQPHAELFNKKEPGWDLFFSSAG